MFQVRLHGRGGYHRDRWLVVSASPLAVTTFGRPLPGAPLLGGSPR
jgi:hypothetical protein